MFRGGGLREKLFANGFTKKYYNIISKDIDYGKMSDSEVYSYLDKGYAVAGHEPGHFVAILPVSAQDKAKGYKFYVMDSVDLNPTKGRTSGAYKRRSDVNGLTFTYLMHYDGPTNSNSSTSYSTNTKINNMLKKAVEIANDDTHKYVYGADGPRNFDCSGFTSYLVTKYLGVTGIPRTSSAQASWLAAKGCKRSSLSSAQPGDILWQSGHVGMYLGGEKFVHAANSRAGIVVASNFSSYGWKAAYNVSKLAK